MMVLVVDGDGDAGPADPRWREITPWWRRLWAALGGRVIRVWAR